MRELGQIERNGLRELGRIERNGENASLKEIEDLNRFHIFQYITLCIGDDISSIFLG